ncbi:Protein arginine N-methyltransferase PRMT10 [Hibiscus syriacus]|uniref:Protein arginine N-methyltransferase PRMT10 n=1 Tax=Hibiscus syriacus TaxID=106335 RepID=A0A6A3CRC4_HIBSY|nr:Protein arginine N-methyltransferase PRMT10 [Hibiscus syriacus]
MGSRTNGVAGGSSNRLVDKGADFANYFCTYAFLYHQKEMLSDRVRMDAYYNAVFKNKHYFHGKLVQGRYMLLKQPICQHARTLVQANNLQDIIEVIEGSMEKVVLPEKGWYHQSIFNSVICARDRWPKPTGVM